jgi:hypothetical protein
VLAKMGVATEAAGLHPLKRHGKGRWGANIAEGEHNQEAEGTDMGIFMILKFLNETVKRE